MELTDVGFKGLEMNISRKKLKLQACLFTLFALLACSEPEPSIIKITASYDTKMRRSLTELSTIAKEMALKRPQLKLAAEDKSVSEYYSKAKERVYSKDFKVAETMFLNLAEQGYADAQTRLFNFYSGGHGEPKDLRDLNKTRYWLERALNSGYAEAHYSYALGFLVKREPLQYEDWGLYAEWLYIAAEQGHADAQESLSSIYLVARGVERDLIESYKWSTLAIARYKRPQTGEEIRKSSSLNLALWGRDLLTSREGMTVEQVKEAKKRVIEWERTHPYAYPPINKNTDIEWKNIDLLGGNEAQ